MTKLSSVLVVDDDPDLLFVMGSLVGLLGYEAVTASSVVEAETLLKGKSFDLALCDVSMPGVDGITFFRTLQAEGVRLPPFVFVTGLEDFPLRKPYPGGVADIVRKPMKLADLELTLKRHGARRSGVPAELTASGGTSMSC